MYFFYFQSFCILCSDKNNKSSIVNMFIVDFLIVETSGNNSNNVWHLVKFYM